MISEEERKARNCEKQKSWARNHPEKHRAMVRKWEQDNPERYRETRKKWKIKWVEELRLGALNALGGQCVQCQCKDTRCLQIDHIVPLQGKARSAYTTLYRSIIDGSTENLQVLCANCHAIKTYYENGERGG